MNGIRRSSEVDIFQSTRSKPTFGERLVDAPVGQLAVDRVVSAWAPDGRVVAAITAD